jgi:hypothetical protein
MSEPAIILASIIALLLGSIAFTWLLLYVLGRGKKYE